MGRVISYGEKTGYNDGDYLLLDNSEGGTKRIRPDLVGPRVDSYPTAGSTNAVQSGGVKRALDTLHIDPDDLGLYYDENASYLYPTYRDTVSANGIFAQFGGGGGGATIKIINNKLMISTSSSSDGDSSNIVGTGTVGHMILNDSSGGNSSNIVGTGTVGRMVV